MFRIRTIPISLICLTFASIAWPHSECDRVNLPKAQAQHVVIYHNPAHWAGAPANGGIWNWGNEILVAFQICVYKPREDWETHSYDFDKPSVGALARSLDGGKTWSFEPYEELGHPLFHNNKHQLEPRPCPGGIDFKHPDFAMICRSGYFFISYDRGRKWQGPYAFGQFEEVSALTSRTDYIVNGKSDCRIFISGKVPQVQAGRYKDRAFCARTTDGGNSFQFLGWMTDEPLVVRSVMPSTVCIGGNHLVSALRRRFDLNMPGPNIHQNWIDMYQSEDGGKTWEYLSKIADTDPGNELKKNGNPPALLRLKDGRLVVAYAYRGEPFGIYARISKDNGNSWGTEITLRNDGRNWDLGYPRMVMRSDGKLVTVYWIATEKRREHHIAATIWDPDKISETK